MYLHVLSWPGDAVLHIPELHNQVRTAYLLADPARNLAVSRENDGIFISIPEAAPDRIDTVVAVKLDGAPRVPAPLLTQSSDSAFHLDYLRAATAGNAVKRFNRKSSFHIAKWSGPADSASWNLLVSQTGEYTLRIRYASPVEWAGGRYLIAVGNQKFSGTVQATGRVISTRASTWGPSGFRRRAAIP